MFIIQHKCADSDPISDYSIQVGARSVGNGNPVPLTRILCPKCREEFIVLGTDMFGAAKPVETGIPGFVIPRGVRPD